MTTSTADRSIPKGAAIGAVALVLFAVAGVSTLSVERYADLPPVAVLEQRALLFQDRPDGSVAVLSASDGTLVHSVPPGGDGFIRGTMRGLNRERVMSGIAPETPFELTRYADGRFELRDTATGRKIDLRAFGATNTAAFERLLTSGEKRP